MVNVTALRARKALTHIWSALFASTSLLYSPGTQLAASAATPLGPPTFGSPDRSWGTRRSVTKADWAEIASYRHHPVNVVKSTNFTSPEELKQDWLLQSDDKPDLQSCRRPENISVKTGVLKLRTMVAKDCHARWSTGSMISSFHQKYGFFEARMKTANATGINNAFWLVTEDGFEIDIAEVHFPGTVRTTLHNHKDYKAVKGDNNWGKGTKSDSVGFNNKFRDNFSEEYHAYGVLWTPKEIIFEVDGVPINVIVTNGAIKEAADVRFSTAVMEYAGKIPVHPENRDMTVNQLRIVGLNE